MKPLSDSASPTPNLIELASDIVSAYVAKNALPAAELPGLINSVHEALNGLGKVASKDDGEAARPVPKLSPAAIRRSITADHLISFEDGKPYRSIKRHLAKHGLTPDEYRAKWGLPKDYPMVAPAYSAQRAELAKRIGLGNSRRKETSDE